MKYKIANIIIDFTYCFDTFFKNSFKDYFVDNSILEDYKLSSFVVDEIVDNKEIDFFNNKHKKIYHDNDFEIIDIYNKNNSYIINRVKVSKSKKIVEILLNSKLDNIAEYEYILTGIYFLDMCQEKGLIPLHASAISYKNEAILFSAPSTTGKSTQAKLWKSALDDVEFINDDKPLISFEDNKFYVYGSPWCGKDGINKNTRNKLKSIVFLNQSKYNYIKELSNKEKLELLMKNIHRPHEENIYDSLFLKFDDLINKVDILNLHCNMETEAVNVLYNRIYKEEQ